MERNAHFQSLSLHIFWDLRKGALPPLSARRVPINRRSVSSTILHLSLKFLGKTIPLPGSPTGPHWNVVSVSQAFCYIYHGVPIEQGLPGKQNLIFLSKSPKKEPPLQVPQRGPYGDAPFPELMVYSFIQ